MKNGQQYWNKWHFLSAQARPRFPTWYRPWSSRTISFFLVCGHFRTSTLPGWGSQWTKPWTKIISLYILPRFSEICWKHEEGCEKCNQKKRNSANQQKKPKIRVQQFMICALQERKWRFSVFLTQMQKKWTSLMAVSPRKTQFNYYKDKEKEKPSKLMAGKALTY